MQTEQLPCWSGITEVGLKTPCSNEEEYESDRTDILLFVQCVHLFAKFHRSLGQVAANWTLSSFRVKQSPVCCRSNLQRQRLSIRTSF